MLEVCGKSFATRLMATTEFDVLSGRYETIKSVARLRVRCDRFIPTICMVMGGTSMLCGSLRRFPTAGSRPRLGGAEENPMVRRSIITAAVLTLLAPATAAAKSERQKYIGIRVEAEEQLDKGEVGPDLRHTGVKSPSGRMVRAKARHFAEAYRELRNKVDPPPVPVASGGGGGSPIPGYIIECESGGSWTAVNPSSGAYGRFQIMPFWWSGACAHLDRSPAGQIACATIIVKQQGLGAWDCA